MPPNRNYYVSAGEAVLYFEDMKHFPPYFLDFFNMFFLVLNNNTSLSALCFSVSVSYSFCLLGVMAEGSASAARDSFTASI